jgi:peptide/nickel transport system permease protein
MRFKQDKAAIVAGIVILLLIFLAIFGGALAERISGHPQNEPYAETMLDDFGIPSGPNSSFWFGADAAGRDLFVRTMYGARTSLLVGIVASGLAVMIGTLVGLLAGFFGSWTDMALSRGADVMLAVPSLLISIGIVASCSTTKQGCMGGLVQPGLTLVILVIVLFSWSYVARVVRGATLSLKEKEFVEASRSIGAGARASSPVTSCPTSPLRSSFSRRPGAREHPLRGRTVVPGPRSPARSGLVGADPCRCVRPLRRSMVADGVPRRLLVVTTLAFNLLGDGLRDALDVRTDR